MAKECRRCGTITYDEAPDCDTCGRKFSRDAYRSWLMIALVAAVAMGIAIYLMR
jgi:hypothetical protein